MFLELSSSLKNATQNLRNQHSVNGKLTDFKSTDIFKVTFQLRVSSVLFFISNPTYNT